MKPPGAPTPAARARGRRVRVGLTSLVALSLAPAGPTVVPRGSGVIFAATGYALTVSDVLLDAERAVTVRSADRYRVFHTSDR